MIYCMAAESVWASRQCCEFSSLAFHRGWSVQTRLVPVEPPRPQGWRCRPTGLTAWWAIRTRLANYSGVIRKQPELVEEHIQALRAQLARVREAPRILPDVEAELS